MLKLFAAALVLAISLNAAAVDARFAKACEKDAKSRVVNTEILPISVQPPEVMPSNNIRLSMQKPPVEDTTVVLGLSATKPIAELSYTHSWLQDEKSGDVCLSSDVVITLGYSPIQIKIAEELWGDACMKRETLRHENEHVEAYRDHLPLVGQYVLADVTALLGKTVFYGKSVKEAEAQAVAFLDEAIASSVRKHFDAGDSKQAALDTSANLVKEMLVCGQRYSEIYQIIRDANKNLM